MTTDVLLRETAAPAIPAHAVLPDQTGCDHDLYLAHRPLIERALTLICRRHRLRAVDAEDFSSSFRLHLMARNYAILQAFEGRSSLKTYLVTVVARYFQDWRNARWGKWRPSAEARRLGGLAVQLETLTVRDRYSFDEAVQILRTNEGINEPVSVLEGLAAKLPRASPGPS